MRKTWSLRGGIPLLAVAALAVFLVLWSFRSQGGTTENVGIRGFVEYTVYDAAGDLKYQSARLNTTMALLKTDIRDRIGKAGTTIASDTALYDGLQLANTDKAGTAPSNIQLAANLDANPVEGAKADVGTNGYSVTKTFTAAGASTIEEFQLARGDAVSGAALSSIGAFQDVKIVLATGDTLIISWTVVIN